MHISPVNHPDAGVYVCRGVHGRSVIVLAVILHVISELILSCSMQYACLTRMHNLSLYSI